VFKLGKTKEKKKSGKETYLLSLVNLDFSEGKIAISYSPSFTLDSYMKTLQTLLWIVYLNYAQTQQIHELQLNLRTKKKKQLFATSWS
jgi:hypothetical protein